jgi:hypothetical protein
MNLDELEQIARDMFAGNVGDLETELRKAKLLNDDEGR